ncbi:hypothetical protein MTO96_050543 [Rhipicephalus appendiculatus]
MNHHRRIALQESATSGPSQSSAQEHPRSAQRAILVFICVFGVVAGIVAALTVAVAVWLKLWKHDMSDKVPSSPASHVCETADCRYIAEWFGATLNHSVDPCDNFYEYVCGSSPNQEHALSAIQTRMGSIVDGGFVATHVPHKGPDGMAKSFRVVPVLHGSL